MTSIKEVKKDRNMLSQYFQFPYNFEKVSFPWYKAPVCTSNWCYTTPNTCWNWILEPNEECDSWDSNWTDWVSCSKSCILCWNGIVWSWEDIDLWANNFITSPVSDIPYLSDTIKNKLYSKDWDI